MRRSLFLFGAVRGTAGSHLGRKAGAGISRHSAGGSVLSHDKVDL